MQDDRKSRQRREPEPGPDIHGAERQHAPRQGGDAVFIQVTANNTRTTDQKKALFRRLAELLGEDPGLRSEDLFVSLVEVEKENWSLGNGLAQYA